jgi:hypothetical protein
MEVHGASGSIRGPRATVELAQPLRRGPGMKTPHRFATVSFLVFSTLSGASCLAELGEGDDALTGATAPEVTEEETSALFYEGFWTDDPSNPRPTRTTRAVAMARNFDKTYTWYNDGLVCRGSNTVTCADGYWNYSAPDNNNWKVIHAVAFEPFSNRVYAWYKDARYTIGSPTVLRSISDKQGFLLPPKPGGGSFAMDDLIDVYCQPQPMPWLATNCVYYWKNGPDARTGTVWRTVGTPGNPISSSGAKQVTNTPSHGEIVGIDMNYGNGKVYTWYSDGKLNMSTDSLNLAQ